MFHLQWHRKFSPGIWQSLFYLLLLAYGVTILLTFSEYGITDDERTHTTYGENWSCPGSVDGFCFGV